MYRSSGSSACDLGRKEKVPLFGVLAAIVNRSLQPQSAGATQRHRPLGRFFFLFAMQYELPSWVINWLAQGEDISSAPAEESGRCRALPRPPWRARLGEGRPMSAYRYQ